MSLLRAARLAKSFGAVRAVRDFSVTLEAGELVALIGPNGAGKSTCFALLGGQLAPDRGTIALDGQILAGSAQDFARRGVARSFQLATLFASMTVRENVQTALLAQHRRIWRFWRAADERFRGEAEVLLDRVGLGGQAERGAAALAYGDLKRLELAVALAGAPRLLLLDEPTAGMAQAERQAMMRLVASLAAAGNLAVLFTEHDMDAVFGFAQRILVLDRGAVLTEGSPDAIAADARVRDLYLGAAPC
jgi:branched-chain amino acid transport system ATP-binding protein